jgi:serine protease Do
MRLVVVLFTTLAALSAAPLGAATPALDALSETMTHVVSQVRPAVVMVQAELHTPQPVTEVLNQEHPGSRLDNLLHRTDPHVQYLLSLPGLIPVNQGLGSGVIIDPTGLVLTNAHLVQGFNVFFISLLDHSEYPAHVVGFDALSDIGLLQIVNADGRTFPTVPLGRSADLEIGQMVLAIGTPLEPELAQSVSAGIISALGRSVDVAEYENFIQTDCAINPGNSGGPLVNLRGELVGINTAIATLTGTYSGIGFAVPIDDAKRVAEALQREGRVSRSYLGVMITDLSRDSAQVLQVPEGEGALVNVVNPDTPAQAAGLRPYDVVVSCDGQPIENANALKMRISSSQVGSTVNLRLVRAGQTISVPIELTELTAETLGPHKGSTAITAPPPAVDSSSFGITVGDLTAQVRDTLRLDPETKLHGVVVTHTAPGSYAAHVGVWPGTQIAEVNERPVENAAQFREIVDHLDGDLVMLKVETSSGDPAIVTLRRGQ